MKARPNIFKRVESTLERTIQGLFDVFPHALESIELGRALERSMDENTVLRADGRFLVPVSYDIYISIKDHQYLAPSQGTLLKGAQEQMIHYARKHNYILTDTPILRLHADTNQKQGKVRIIPAAEDMSGAGHMNTQALSQEELEKIKNQVHMQQQAAQQAQQAQQASPYAAGYGGVNNVQAPAGQQIPEAHLFIRLPQGGQRTYRIDKPVVSIGRQLDNDIIVEDTRVGRYHAQLKFEPTGHFALYDLRSTNGTTLNRRRITQPQVLNSGDIFTIGNYDFQFERR